MKENHRLARIIDPNNWKHLVPVNWCVRWWLLTGNEPDPIAIRARFRELAHYEVADNGNKAGD